MWKNYKVLLVYIFMVGLLLWKTEKRERAVTVGERNVLRLRVMCAEILRTPKTTETLLRRRITAAGRRLRKLGITRVILPEDFPFWALLEKLGLQPVSTVSLRQALAADWVGWLLSERGAVGAAVAVCADRLTGDVARTVTELALRHRYVLLDLPYGGEQLCHRLRREYGVSLLMSSSAEQLEQAEALVLFAPRADLHREDALRLYDERTPLPGLTLPPPLEEGLPPGVNRGQLLSALREAGVIRPGEILVGDTNPAKKGSFFTDSPP